MSRKRPKKKENTSEHHGATNFNDVLIKFIDVVYNLVNSGNIFGVLLVFVFAEIFFITYKITDDMLDKYIWKVLSYEYFYVFPLGFALMCSLVMNYHQANFIRVTIQKLSGANDELAEQIKPAKRDKEN